MEKTEEVTGEDSEAVELGRAASNIIRPKGDAFSSLLVHHLALAVSSEPLQSAVYIIKAANMFSPEEMKNLGLNPEEVSIIGAVAYALQRSTSQTFTSGGYQYETHPIPWGFRGNEDNYKKYIDPWVQGYEYLSSLIKKHVKWVPALKHNNESVSYPCNYTLKTFSENADSSEISKAKSQLSGTLCPRCGYLMSTRSGMFSESNIEEEDVHAIDPNPEWSFFFEVSGCLSETGYNKVKTAFVRWSQSKVSRMLTALSKSISKRDYDLILKKFLQEEKSEKSEE